jgi:uncharacterized protein with PQ loop repeat
MHVILCSACALDFLYSFGRHMPWQYKVVTLSGLACLFIQHIQVYRYADYTIKSKTIFWFASVFLICLLLLIVHGLWLKSFNYSVLMAAEDTAQTCWIIYVLPQVIKNYKFKTTEGISLYFVILGAIASASDSISAWCLNWDYPNKFGSPLGLLFKILLLTQFLFKFKQDRVPVIN